MEENYNHLSIETRENLLGMLVSLSTSDGNMNPKELQYLQLAARQLGLDPDKIAGLSKQMPSEMLLPSTEKDRMTALYYLLFLTVQDDQMNKMEEDFIYHFGFKLGFNESMLRDMLLLFSQSGKPNNPDELLNIIKKYLN